MEGLDDHPRKSETTSQNRRPHLTNFFPCFRCAPINLSSRFPKRFSKHTDIRVALVGKTNKSKPTAICYHRQGSSNERTEKWWGCDRCEKNEWERVSKKQNFDQHSRTTPTANFRTTKNLSLFDQSLSCDTRHCLMRMSNYLNRSGLGRCKEEACESYVKWCCTTKMPTVEEWFKNLPIMTKSYFMLIVTTTFLIYFGVVQDETLFLMIELIFQRFQVTCT